MPHLAHPPTSGFSVSVHGHTLRAFEVVEDADIHSPNLIAGPLQVLELPGSINGSRFVFWLGDLEPGSPAVIAAVTAFANDHDVTRIEYIRGAPRRV
jgi:hypothetical protein